MTFWKLIALLPLLLLLQWPLQAGPVRISFLTDKKALQDTMDFLQKNGCEIDAVTAFGKAVEEYNEGGLKFDVSRLPRAESGFYSFPSVAALLSTLSARLWESPHTFGFNCFDTVFVIASGKFRTELRPDDHFDEFLPAGVLPNGDLAYAHAQTARDAFNLSCPAFYQKATVNDIPPSSVDTRIVLTAEMYCFHMLPTSTTRTNVETEVIGTLSESWKKQKVIFPSDFQILLFHQVTLTRHFFATTHAGLVFHEHDGYCFLEKEGGQGPFIRLEFQNRRDLLTWLSGTCGKCSGEYLFATFNDSEIELIKP